MGLRFNSTGSELFASGAEKETVHRFDFKSGYLSNHRELQIVPIKERQVPAGITLSADDQTLFVASPWGNTVCVWPLDKPDSRKFIKFDDEALPYFALPDAEGKRLYVSLWGKSAVAVINLSTMAVEATWPTQSHPTESLLTKDQKTLYVACANSNNVTVLDTESGRAIETISSALFPTAANGSTPNSVSLSPDEQVLLIANATNNNVAMIDVRERGRSHSLALFRSVGIRHARDSRRMMGASMLPMARLDAESQSTRS